MAVTLSSTLSKRLKKTKSNSKNTLQKQRKSFHPKTSNLEVQKSDTTTSKTSFFLQRRYISQRRKRNRPLAIRSIRFSLTNGLLSQS